MILKTMRAATAPSTKSIASCKRLRGGESCARDSPINLRRVRIIRGSVPDESGRWVDSVEEIADVLAVIVK